MKRLFIVAAIIALSGCASIPVAQQSNEQLCNRLGVLAYSNTLEGTEGYSISNELDKRGSLVDVNLCKAQMHDGAMQARADERSNQAMVNALSQYQQSYQASQPDANTQAVINQMRSMQNQQEFQHFQDVSRQNFQRYQDMNR